jgi:nucleotide-binding universal stress UspA family protein
VTVHAAGSECAFQFDPIGRNKYDGTGCDVAMSYLAKAGIPYQKADLIDRTGSALVSIGPAQHSLVNPADLPAAERAAAIAAFRADLQAALDRAGYPAAADPARIDKVRLIAILFYLVLLVTMVYGPMAALLVELFPGRIRYTSMSLPYHLGNGVFGGLVPIIGLSIIQATGNNFAGLWYPMAVAGICAVIGFWKLPETNHVDISSDHSIASIRAPKGVAASGRRILVPLDGSDTSEAVLAHARKLAKADGSELVLLQVANSAAEIFNDPAIAADDLQTVATADKSYMEALLARLKSEGVLASVEIRQGPVAETILEAATDMKVDMIAMSTHGRSGLQKLLMGSVTEWMIKNSPVPVLVIRPK